MNIPYCDLQLLVRNLKGFFKHAICRAIALTLFSSFDRNVNFLSRGIDFIAEMSQKRQQFARNQSAKREMPKNGKI